MYAPQNMVEHPRPQCKGSAALLVLVDSRGNYTDTSAVEETVLIALPDKESNQDPFFGYQMNECKIIGFMDSVPPGCQAVFDVQKYNLYPTGNSISMLVDPLEEIDRNRSKKVILWKKLKELYNLKSASQKSL